MVNAIYPAQDLTLNSLTVSTQIDVVDLVVSSDADINNLVDDMTVTAGKLIDGKDIGTLNDPQIETGTYTGNGSTTQNIALGFTPDFVIVGRVPTADDGLTYSYFTHISAHAAYGNNNVGIRIFATSGDSWDDRLGLGTDLFIVDDGNSDADPNANGVSYWYIAFKEQT